MEEDNFGEFGKGVEPVFKSRKKRRLRFYVSCFLIAFFIPGGVYSWKYFHDNYFERGIPKITLPDPPEGIGATPLSFDMKVTDNLAGIDEIVVRYEQNGRLKEFKKIKIDKPGVREKKITLEIDGPQLGLKPGEVSFSVVAFDKSFWSNSFKADILLNVDYVKPKIEVFTTQHNAVHGGAELVFYRLKDDRKKFVGLSGIKMGGWLFPGFPAKFLDEAFEAFPDLYFTFFPVPLDYNPDGAPIRLFARDGVGNVSTSSLYYRVKDFKIKSVSKELDPNFLEERVDQVYQSYLQFLVETKDYDESKKYVEAENIEELVQRFRFLNVEYRRDIERSINALLSKPRMTRYWKGGFSRNASSKREYSFGELINYQFEGIGGGSILSGGHGISAEVGRPVWASNEGIVIFADFLGPYGEVVILDHGFGLTSFYANLKDRTVEEGARVEKGKQLGSVGKSGLFQDPVFHFEIRLHGVPVRPEEWFDKKWVKDHIEAKINDVKKSLGLAVRRSLK